MMAERGDPARALEEGVSVLGMALEAESLERLLSLAELLAEWARQLNLTAHRTPEAIVRRLVLDALALGQHLPPADRIVDLGSGAGFPGLPLAVLRPDAEVLLVEARERRHHFQRAAIRELGLMNAQAVRGRIEALEPSPAQGVVAQALARPRAAVELALPWTASGGWIALPGAETPPEPGPCSGISRSEVRHYQVPCGGPARTLWLGWTR